MYNESQKNKFINYIAPINKSYAKIVKRTFDGTELYENELNKDVSEFYFDQIKIVLAGLNGKSMSSINAQLLILKSYCEWCQNNEKTIFDNPMKYFTVESIDRQNYYEITLLKNPEQLQDFLDITCPEIGILDVRNTYRLLCWLLYVGIDIDQLIKMGQDDFEDNVACVNEKEVEIPDEAAEIINLIKEYQYFYKNAFNNLQIPRKIYSKDYILGSYKEIKPERRKKRCSELLVDLRKEYESFTGESCYLSIDRIYESGCFYRMYLKELKSGIIDYSELYEYKIAKSVDKTEFREKRIKRNVLQNYNQWKKTFYS